jgi:tetratricopeptide (TPR) repeat protein
MFRKAFVGTAVALLCSTAAQAEWREATSKHFIVYSDGDQKSLTEYTEKLERFDQAVRAMRLMPDPPLGRARKVTMYLLDDIPAVAKLYGKGGDGVAGFYIPRAHPIAFAPRKGGQSSMVILHEYTHHLMLSNWTDAALPTWFIEGFAELHATAMFEKDGSVIFGAIPEGRRYTVGQANFMPLGRMLKSKLSSNMNIYERDALYSRGWLLTHYLTFDAGRRKQLADYIGAINSGKKPEEAADVLDGISDMALTNYAKRTRIQSIQIPADKINIGAITVRTLSAGEAAVMPARMRSVRGVDKTMAQEVVQLARKLAAPYPNDAAAQAELAEAEYDAQNYAAAEAAADRAIAADPKFINGPIYKGMAKAAVAKKAKSKDEATWREIRRWFLMANKINPDDPTPLTLFYNSYDDAGQKPSKNAQDGLLYAYILAPQDLGLRFMAGKVLLAQNHADKARSALAPIAYHPHAGEQGKKVAEVLAVLEKDGTAKALEMVQAIEDENKKKAEEEEAKK